MARKSRGQVAIVIPDNALVSHAQRPAEWRAATKAGRIYVLQPLFNKACNIHTPRAEATA